MLSGDPGTGSIAEGIGSGFPVTGQNVRGRMRSGFQDTGNREAEAGSGFQGTGIIDD